MSPFQRRRLGCDAVLMGEAMVVQVNELLKFKQCQDRGIKEG